MNERNMEDKIKSSSETLSLRADFFLDGLGYSADRIKERIFYWDKCSAAKSISTQNITKRDDIIRIFVGSQREGTGMSFVNDTDILQIYTSVSCIEDDSNLTLDDKFVVFLLDNTKAPAGHSLLQLLNPESKSLQIQELTYALENIDGKIYLSSEKFMQKNDDFFATCNGSISGRTHYMDRKGPSIPKYTEPDWLTKQFFTMNNIPFIQEYDFVRGFPCHCPSIIRRWKLRSRKYDWPTASDIEIASNLPACVVPVGEKESENQHMQWRVCFTLAEMHLIKSMNNTHTKVHVLLKMIAKHYLKLECEDISSYVIKNVMFWMAEETPSDNYRPEYLINRLTEALTFLKDCIHKKELKNYMIPERNLLASKLAGNTGELLVNKLNNLTDNIMTYAQIMLENDIPKKIENIIDLQYLANFLDRCELIKVSAVSLEQLSTFFGNAAHIQTGLKLQLYPFVYILPFILLKFRFELFTDPMQIAHEKVIGNQADVAKSLHCTVWPSHANKTEQTTNGTDLQCTGLEELANTETSCKRSNENKSSFTDTNFTDTNNNKLENDKLHRECHNHNESVTNDQKCKTWTKRESSQTKREHREKKMKGKHRRQGSSAAGKKRRPSGSSKETLEVNLQPLTEGPNIDNLLWIISLIIIYLNRLPLLVFIHMDGTTVEDTCLVFVVFETIHYLFVSVKQLVKMIFATEKTITVKLRRKDKKMVDKSLRLKRNLLFTIDNNKYVLKC